jgi:hypothetical protein
MYTRNRIENSSSCSQEFITESHPETVESNPHFHILRPILKLSFHQHLGPLDGPLIKIVCALLIFPCYMSQPSHSKNIRREMKL